MQATKNSKKQHVSLSEVAQKSAEASNTKPVCGSVRVGAQDLEWRGQLVEACLSIGIPLNAIVELGKNPDIFKYVVPSQRMLSELIPPF